MRTIDLINKDIVRCQNQIAATYEYHNPQNKLSAEITREGFQIQLCKLFCERDFAIKQINVVGAEVVVFNKSAHTNKKEVFIK